MQLSMFNPSDKQAVYMLLQTIFRCIIHPVEINAFLIMRWFQNFETCLIISRLEVAQAVVAPSSPSPLGPNGWWVGDQTTTIELENGRQAVRQASCWVGEQHCWQNRNVAVWRWSFVCSPLNLSSDLQDHWVGPPFATNVVYKFTRPSTTLYHCSLGRRFHRSLCLRCSVISCHACA